jgi:hypothetical protein
MVDLYWSGLSAQQVMIVKLKTDEREDEVAERQETG